MINSNQKKNIQHWQIIAICMIACDIVTIHASYFLALWIRFDCIYSAIPKEYIIPYNIFITPYAIFSVVIFWYLRMYRIVWRYASYSELFRTFSGSLITSFIHVLAITVLLKRMPLSYYLIGTVFQLIFLIIPRFSFRMILFIVNLRNGTDETVGRVMIIGAGQAGQMLIRDLKLAGEVHDKAVCIIDDSSNKWGRFIDGVPIVGGRDDILLNVEKLF